MTKRRLSLSTVAALVLFLLRAASLGQSNNSPTPADCNAPTANPITYVSLPGHPFGSAVTKDGCWVFVSVSKDKSQEKDSVAMLRRSGGALTLEKVFPVPDVPLGMTLTHDNKLLIVADSSYVVYFDVQGMISGNANPLVGELHDKQSPGNIEAGITSDDKLLFISNEWHATITVIDLQKARDANFSIHGMIGRIPVGENPIAMVFSPDEKLLYTTSEGPASSVWPRKCPAGIKGEIIRPRHGVAGRFLLREGAVTVIDVARAKLEPEKSALASVPAGCATERLAISPGGEYVYATAQEGNAVLAFDAAELAHGSRQALVGQVPVGPDPAPVAVVDGGKKILVGNSNRGGSSKNDKQDIVVIDAARISSGKAAVLGKIPAGASPQEFSQSPDGKTLFLANFNSDSLEIIDLTHLQVPEPSQRADK